MAADVSHHPRVRELLDAGVDPAEAERMGLELEARDALLDARQCPKCRAPNVDRLQVCDGLPRPGELWQYICDKCKHQAERIEPTRRRWWLW